jgi:transposase
MNKLARSNCYTALKLLTGREETQLEADCLWRLADIARVKWEYKKARKLYRRARSRYIVAAVPTGEARSIRGLADVASTQHNYKEARDLYGQALDLYRRANAPADEASCVRALADMAWAQRDGEKARDLYAQARDLFARAGKRTDEADCLSRLGHMAWIHSDHEKARDLYAHARDLYGRAGTLTAHLPRERIEHPAARVCPRCGGSRLTRVGLDEHEVLEYVASRFKFIVHVRPKMSCRDCEMIAEPSLPSLLIQHGMPEPGLLAHVIASKYCSYSPLHHQSISYWRQNVEIDPPTMADWVEQIVLLLEPLANSIAAHVRAGQILHTDNIPVPVIPT